LTFGSAKPEDVEERVKYRGARRQYAQLRYGSPGSTRVTVVAVEIDPSKTELYVDADRNRRIDEQDRVEGRDGTWSLPLQIATVEGESTSYARGAIVVRRGQTSAIWSCAAAGFMEGQVLLDGRETA
jgi:hypothetical protein